MVLIYIILIILENLEFFDSPNKALHPTAIPLRFIAAGELDRSADTGQR